MMWKGGLSFLNSYAIQPKRWVMQIYAAFPNISVILECFAFTNQMSPVNLVLKKVPIWKQTIGSIWSPRIKLAAI